MLESYYVLEKLAVERVREDIEIAAKNRQAHEFALLRKREDKQMKRDHKEQDKTTRRWSK